VSLPDLRWPVTCSSSDYGEDTLLASVLPHSKTV
jgi:hypothetical protein